MTLVVLNAAEGMLDMAAGALGEPSPHCAQQWQAPSRGTEILAPALQAMLGIMGTSVREVRRWACVRGPGSFTGVRLTLATVAAMRRVTGAEVAGLDYMQALACAGQRAAMACGVLCEQDAARWLWVLTHARRDLVHCQPFAWQASGTPTPVTEVDLCSPAEAGERMLASPQGAFMLGSGVARNREVLAAALGVVRVLDVVMPSAQDLWLLARHAEYACADIEPLYVRPCDAVDNLDHISRKQGVDPAAAHARLRQLLAAPPVAEPEEAEK